MPFATFLITYVVGGVTFIPLLLVLVFAHGYYFLPHRHGLVDDKNSYLQPEGVAAQDIDDKFRQGTHDADGAAGYFAVCREYVPGGVNGKPPAKTTPAGEAISAESPSVYQSMYRSIFERGKTQTPAIEVGTPTKRARNVFFVILRHGHLVLFDNSEQLEIRHVISLSHHHIDVYAGGEPVPEGELWIKRNCIRLRKRASAATSEQADVPFYLFSDNCSEKEDFYHAMVQQQDVGSVDDVETPRVIDLEKEDMIKLIRYIHVSEENSQTRWLNAICGRLFLALYKTSDVEDFIRRKITKKMTRVAKPAFITSLRLEEVALGDSAPLFINPKLREMTIDGSLTIETDVRYSGNFKAVIAAVARIELGSRFKPREVNMVLAGVLKKLEGHLLVKIKPPPSNRIWISFETMPKLDISLEPIVSSRQITYGVILRTMVSRIREVISETVVLPNWDDIPFTDTSTQDFRGGIWAQGDKEISQEGEDDATVPVPQSESQQVGHNSTTHGRSSSISSDVVPTNAEVASALHLPHSESPPASPSLAASLNPESLDSMHSPTTAEKPKAMRSNSFAAAASPIVSKSPATNETLRRQSRKGHRDATTAMKTLSSRSPEKAAVQPSTDAGPSAGDRASSTRQRKSSGQEKATETIPSPPEADSSGSIGDDVRLRTKSLSEPLGNNGQASSSPPAKGLNGERAKAINQSIASATVAARNWSWNMLNRQNEDLRSKASDKSAPMGRGQPLPPLGTPLPRPEKPAWSAAALSSLRRKPVASSSVDIQQPTEGFSSSSDVRPMASANALTSQSENKEQARLQDDVLTVDAPADSAPATPERSPLRVASSSDSGSLAAIDVGGLHDDPEDKSTSSWSTGDEHSENRVSDNACT